MGQKASKSVGTTSTMIVRNDHTGQELRAVRMQSDICDTLSVIVLQTTVSKGEGEKRKVSILKEGCWATGKLGTLVEGSRHG